MTDNEAKTPAQDAPEATVEAAAQSGGENSAQADAAASADTAALEQRLAEAEARAQSNWEHVLRTQAELENLRRRTERELENAHKYALERFAQELLPVRDSLEMGLAAASADEVQAEKLREGTELTLKMLATAMEKFGITAVDPKDQPFDPERHQAMSMQESTEAAPNTVLAVMQKGYLLNERLIRPAMVVVAKSPANPGGQIDEKA